MNKRKVPKLRFKGFTDDWEQRKVSEITKFHKQGFYTTEDYNESKKYYLLRGTDLTENKLILKDTPKIDSTEKDYQAFKTEVGDFLIVRTGTVGTYGIVYEDIPAIFGSYLIDFRFDMEQVTNEFFGYFYQSESFRTQLRQIVQQSANTNINAENIKSTSIMLPSVDEQKRIGEYLGQIDNLITLHQCLDIYYIPKVRTYNIISWEQRKLDDLVSFSKGSGYSKGDLKEDGTQIILYGRLYTKYETVISGVDTFVDAKENSVYSKGGEVIVPGSGETAEDISIASVVEKSGVLLGGDLNIITPPKDIDAAFLAISISNGKPHNDMAKMAQGKSVVHLHNTDLAKIDLPYPSYEEQRKISGSFSEFDSLITLHQLKLKHINFTYTQENDNGSF